MKTFRQFITEQKTDDDWYDEGIKLVLKDNFKDVKIGAKTYLVLCDNTGSPFILPNYEIADDIRSEAINTMNFDRTYDTFEYDNAYNYIIDIKNHSINKPNYIKRYNTFSYQAKKLDSIITKYKTLSQVDTLAGYKQQQVAKRNTTYLYHIQRLQKFLYKLANGYKNNIIDQNLYWIKNKSDVDAILKVFYDDYVYDKIVYIKKMHIKNDKLKHFNRDELNSIYNNLNLLKLSS